MGQSSETWNQRRKSEQSYNDRKGNKCSEHWICTRFHKYVWYIKDEKVEKLIKNRIEQADDISIRVGIAAREEGEREAPSKELFILCHKDDKPTLGKHEKAFTEWKREPIITETFDRGKYVFADFRLGLHLEDIKEYRYRKEEYEKGELVKMTDLGEEIGKIFAYPEWFPEDENVKAVFKK